MILPKSSLNGANLDSARDKNGKYTKLWWQAVKDDLAKNLWSCTQYLVDKHRTRVSMNMHHLRIYSNRLFSSMTGSAFSSAADTGEKIKLNATKSGIDAATAQIATNNPGVMHLTIKGDRALQLRAARLDRYVAGYMHELQIPAVGLGVFLDACIDGPGFLKFIARPDGKVGCERVRSSELLVDDNENPNFIPGSSPSMAIHVRPVSREWLLAQPRFKKFEEKIKEAEYLDRFHPSYAPIDEQLTMVEAWKLPTYNSPGRHVIALSNVAMLDEPWVFHNIPFARFPWNEAPLGYYGMGAVEEALPTQVELNYLAQKIQRLQNFATSILFKKPGSLTQKITNEDFAIYEASEMPQLLNMTAANPELYNQIDRLYMLIYQLLGVSQMQATGAKPSGMYSGEAIRLYYDVATRRFQHTEKRWAQFFLDCATQIEDRSREIVKRGYGTSKTLAFGDKDVEQLEWSDVEMERDMFAMRLRPVSIVPSEPAGKVELIKSLAPVLPGMSQYLVGAISGIPDLEAFVQKANAPFDYAQRLVSQIIDEGIFEPPMPQADPAVIRDVATRELLTAQDNGVDPDRIALIERLILAVDAQQAMNQAVTMPMGMPAQAGLGAGPQPAGMPPQAMAAIMGPQGPSGPGAM